MLAFLSGEHHLHAPPPPRQERVQAGDISPTLRRRGGQGARGHRYVSSFVVLLFTQREAGTGVLQHSPVRPRTQTT